MPDPLNDMFIPSDTLGMLFDQHTILVKINGFDYVSWFFGHVGRNLLLFKTLVVFRSRWQKFRLNNLFESFDPNPTMAKNTNQNKAVVSLA